MTAKNLTSGMQITIDDGNATHQALVLATDHCGVTLRFPFMATRGSMLGHKSRRMYRELRFKGRDADNVPMFSTY